VRQGLRGCPAAAAAALGEETIAAFSDLIPPRIPPRLGDALPVGCMVWNCVKAPPGETGTAASHRLGRCPLVRTLSATEEVAALLTSRQ
jgi:hypothetical protein